MWPISYLLYTAGSPRGACPYPALLHIYIHTQHLTITNTESVSLPHRLPLPSTVLYLSIPFDIPPQRHCSASCLCTIGGKAAWKATMKYKWIHTK